MIVQVCAWLLFLTYNVHCISFHRMQLKENATIYSDLCDRMGLAMHRFDYRTHVVPQPNSPRFRRALKVKSRQMHLKQSYGYDFPIDVDEMTRLRLLSLTEFLQLPVRVLLVDFSELKETVGNSSSNIHTQPSGSQIGRFASQPITRYINQLSVGELVCQRSDTSSRIIYHRPFDSIKLQLCLADNIDGFYKRHSNGTRTPTDFVQLQGKDLRLMIHSPGLQSVFITRWQLHPDKGRFSRNNERWLLDFNDGYIDAVEQQEMQALLIDLNALFNEHVPSTGNLEAMNHSTLLEDVEMSAEPTNDDDVCGICLEEFGRDKDVAKLKKCSHTFHKECISKWLNLKQFNAPTCPSCRQ